MLEFGENEELFYIVFHLQARFEDNDFSGRDRDYFSGARIPAGAAFSLFYLEDAKIAQLNLFSSSQRLHDTVKGFLHNLFYVNLF